MTSRPTDLTGDLVFQEGKKVEGEYYVVSIYDDPELSRVHFAAYELERDLTYTLTYTYSDFDELFRFNAELMNPNNTDARFHWVVERLDFIVQDYLGNKVLCLAPEPTAAGIADMAGELNMYQRGESYRRDGSSSTYFGEPKSEPTLTQQQNQPLKSDDSGLYVDMMKSEGVRKEFLAEVQGRRRLEQLKAEQRLIKLDEDRANRVAKMQLENQLMQQKALKYKAESASRKQLVDELEELMIKKQQEEIQRLLREKAAAEKDKQARIESSQGRQQCKESNLEEDRVKEVERKAMLDARRAEVSLQRADALKQLNKEIVDKRQRQINVQTRHSQHLAELRRKRSQSLELACNERALAKEERAREWERLEASRNNNEAARERYRRERERKRIIEDVQKPFLLAEAKQRAAIKLQKEKKLEDARAAAHERAVLKERLSSIDTVRQSNIKAKDEDRERRMKEQALMGGSESLSLDDPFFTAESREVETHGNGATQGYGLVRMEEVLAKDHENPRDRKFANDAEHKNSHKEREITEDRREQETLQKGLKYREMEEVRRLEEWKASEQQRKEKNALIRSELERCRDETVRATQAKKISDYEITNRLEKAREQKEKERETTRNSQLHTRLRSVSNAMAIPHLIA